MTRGLCAEGLIYIRGGGGFFLSSCRPSLFCRSLGGAETSIIFVCQYCAAPASTAKTAFGFARFRNPRDIALIVPGFFIKGYNKFRLSEERPFLNTRKTAIKKGNCKSKGRQ